MSNVGSTNAMKKGSGNNPFLANTESDMQSYLNIAYLGSIVKYVGPSTKKGIQEVLPLNSEKDLGKVQNLNVELGISPFYLATYCAETHPTGGTDSQYWKFHFTVTNKTTGKTQYIQQVYTDTYNRKFISTATSGSANTWLLSDWYLTSADAFLTFDDSLTKNVKVLGYTGVGDKVPEYWPLDAGWQTDCFNTEGKIILWGNDEDVNVSCPLVYEYNNGPFFVEPYAINGIYQVAYDGINYFFKPYININDGTDAIIDLVMKGKTFYDFTGTKQTGTGTKINPYIATDLTTFQSFPKGSFIKWLGADLTVLSDGTKLYNGQVYQGVDDGDITTYVILPILTNEGTASDLAKGKEMINSNGEVVVGVAADDIDYTQDVMFWDYNGKLVYACTLDEAKAMTKLPDAPNHTDKGLTFFKWNYTLEEVNALANGVDIGALYMPFDEKTHLFIKTNDNLKHIELYIYKSYASRGASMEIDWGDEFVEQYSWDQNTTPSVISHDYVNAAEYEIVIENTSKSTFKLDNYLNLGKTDYSIFAAQNLFGVMIRYGSITAMATMLTKVYLGKQMNANCGCCPNLTELTTYTNIPPAGLQYSNVKHVNAMTEIGYNAFTNSAIETFSLHGNNLAPNFFSSNLKRIACLAYTQTYSDAVDMTLYQLRRCIWPRATSYRLSATFTACQKIRLDILNDNINTSYYFKSATELYTKKLYPYENNTSIHASIVDAPLLEKFVLDNPTVIPLSAAFTNIPSTCKYYVPDDSVDAYKAAAGWSDMADRIYPISELNQ